MSRQGLSVGDRVRVYREHYAPLDAPVAELGTGIFTGLLRVHGRTTWFHPKQCRKLRPKKKPERVITIEGPRLSGKVMVSGSGRFANCTIDGGWFERPDGEYRLQELRPGEIILDRQRLAEAWDEAVAVHKIAHFTNRATISTRFGALCAALGLPAEEAK